VANKSGQRAADRGNFKLNYKFNYEPLKAEEKPLLLRLLLLLPVPYCHRVSYYNEPIEKGRQAVTQL